MRCLPTFVVVSLTVAVPVRGQTRAGERGHYAGPIIDMHLHAHPADRASSPRPPNPVTGQASAPLTDEALTRATLSELRRHHVVKAVAFSHLQSVERWREAATGIIIPGAQLDQGIQMPAVARLRELHASDRLKMIGEVGAQYLGLFASCA